MQVTPLLSLVTEATVSQAWAHELAGLELVFCSIIPEKRAEGPKLNSHGKRRWSPNWAEGCLY